MSPQAEGSGVEASSKSVLAAAKDASGLSLEALHDEKIENLSEIEASPAAPDEAASKSNVGSGLQLQIREAVRRSENPFLAKMDPSSSTHMSDRASSRSRSHSEETNSKRGRSAPRLPKKKTKSHFENAISNNLMSSDRTTDAIDSSKKRSGPDLRKAIESNAAKKGAQLLDDKEGMKRMHQARSENITRFRKEFPQFKHLTN